MEDMETMLGNVAGHLTSFEDSNQEFAVWVNTLKEASNCEDESDFSAEKFKKTNQGCIVEVFVYRLPND